MKNLLYLIFMFSTLSLNAQDQKNTIKSSLSFGFGSENVKVNTFEIEYQRHIASGINVLIGYTDSNGGVLLKNYISEDAFQKLSAATFTSQYSDNINGVLGTYYRMSGVKLGFQKNIKMANSIELGLSISALYNSISQSELTNIAYDVNEELIVEDLVTQFATYTKPGAEIGLYFNYKINSYINVGMSIKYITINEIIAPGLYAAANF